MNRRALPALRLFFVYTLPCRSCAAVSGRARRRLPELFICFFFSSLLPSLYTHGGNCTTVGAARSCALFICYVTLLGVRSGCV